MIFDEVFFFPFIVFFVMGIVALAILVFAFWIWMIVDCVKRKFKNDTEKVVWILILIFLSWLGAVIYYFVVKHANPKGISK